ncbi:MAG: ParB/RepB/Spo0J family partition protein [Candidatus Doudnabacteria bacterium]|nr:ParB/RepB/Spo0J family partition protein [bacterium]MDZ4243578.1 ParB/RepB/Spo0J family partition protein [Candidatus Doudnabacteria bacterium]
MSDDVFKLGNFEGLKDEELDDLDEAATASSTPTSSPPSHGGELNVIKHPTAKSDPQARFRSPLDGQALFEVELGKIIPNEFQPRRIFNTEKLEELAQSIKMHGIIQPLVVIARPDGMYEIVVGERRFRAAKIAGLSKVPVFVSRGMSSQTKLELALIENVQRADLNPIEEAKAYQQLQQEFGLQITEIAKRVGKDDSTISNLIRLLNLPVEVQRALIEGAIAEGQARPLLSLRDREEMLVMFKIVLKDKMRVRDIESKVREIRNRKIKVHEMFVPDPFLESLENLLRNKFGTRVAVNKGAKGGKITIEFFSDEELNDIVNRMAGP